MKAFKKITAVVLCLVLVLGLFGACATKTENTDKQKTEKKIASEPAEYGNNSYDAENEYFSALETTSNNGLRYNVTLSEFIENYNQLVTEYASTYSIVDKAFIVGADFKKQNGSQQNINGVSCDLYICHSTLFGYQDNYGICVTVEKDSHCIADVSVAVSNDMLMDFSQDERVLNTIQNHIVYRALINELTSEDCYDIDEHIQGNSQRGLVPAHYEKGIAFSLDSSYVSSAGIHYLRIQPCTEEQWKNAPGFSQISIN